MTTIRARLTCARGEDDVYILYIGTERVHKGQHSSCAVNHIIIIVYYYHAATTVQCNSRRLRFVLNRSCGVYTVALLAMDATEIVLSHAPNKR